jgi:DNA-binding XRE family transcriptional regulator
MSQESNESIAVLFKATRKFHRLQQTEFAAILGVTQGTISKIEASSMSPELGLWFKFLRAFKIQDPYCFTYNGIEFDEMTLNTLEKKGSALAPGFEFKKSNYLYNVRKLRPLYDFLMETHTRAFESYLKEHKISKHLFYVLNHPITPEIAQTFFTFLDKFRINSTAISLLDLNFEHSLGREMKDQFFYQNILKIVNSENEFIVNYESSNLKLEYFVNLKDNSNDKLGESFLANDVALNYNLLYPFHLLKSANIISSSVPVITEVTPREKWHVSFAS